MANIYSFMLQPTHTHYQMGDNRMPVRMNMNELQCVAACCSVLQSTHTLPDTRQENSSLYEYEWVAVRCSVLQCVAVHTHTAWRATTERQFVWTWMSCSLLQCVAVHDSPHTHTTGRATTERQFVALPNSPCRIRVSGIDSSFATASLSRGGTSDANSMCAEEVRTGKLYGCAVHIRICRRVLKSWRDQQRQFYVCRIYARAEEL